MTIEYRVRPVTRYLITRFEAKDNTNGGSEGYGELENWELAITIAQRLAKAEEGAVYIYPDADLTGIQTGAAGSAAA